MSTRKIVEIDQEKCDGCGLCVPECPEGAIEIINGKAQLVSDIYCDGLGACLGHCPLDAITVIEREAEDFDEKAVEKRLSPLSQLTNWPIQITLAPPKAPYFEDADLLIAADCVPFAYANFHQMLKGKVLLIGCPKLDEADFYTQKLAGIIKDNNIKSITVAHMEVPCCFGLETLVRKAIELSSKSLDLKTEVLSIKGDKSV